MSSTPTPCFPGDVQVTCQRLVTSEDIEALAALVLAKAKKGDLEAIRILLDLVESGERE